MIIQFPHFLLCLTKNKVFYDHQITLCDYLELKSSGKGALVSARNTLIIFR